MRRHLALAVAATLAIFGALSAPALAANDDLSVTMTANPTPSVPLEGEVTFTAVVANIGTDPSLDVKLTDTFNPADIDLLTATTTAGTCPISGSGIACELGTIAPGANVTVTVVARTKVLGPPPFDYTVEADATPNDTDSVPNNDIATVTTSVVPAANLNVVTTPSESPATAGGTLTYTTVVTNAGPSVATSVFLTDTLPEGAVLEGEPTASGGGTCTKVDSEVTCDLPNLAVGDSATVTIAVKVPGIGPVVNVAAAAAAEIDPASTDNEATTSVPVTAVADLGITASGSSPAVNTGSDINYLLTVSNAGPSPAADVTVTDTLPAGVGFLGFNPSQGSCTIAGVVITCSLGTIPSGGSATVAIRVQATSVGAITNTAQVTSPDQDPSAANNDASVATAVNVAADLALAATGPTTPIPAGGAIAYQFTVTNNGPSPASGVVLEDALPAGVSARSATPSQGACGVTGQVLTCALGTIGSRASVTVAVEVATTTPGTVVHSVSTRGSDPDPNPANNTAVLSTAVADGANLVLTQRGARRAAAIGDEIRYVLRVANRGPSAATGVRVVNSIGRRFILGSATPSKGRCITRGKRVTCVIGRLASGASARVTLVLIPVSAGTLTNTVSASGKPGDGRMENNRVAVTTRVSRTPAALSPR